MPFDVTRAYDEATGIADPRIWTAERDKRDVAGAGEGAERLRDGQSPPSGDHRHDGAVARCRCIELVRLPALSVRSARQSSTTPAPRGGRGRRRRAGRPDARAIDLAQRGVPVLLLDDDDTVSHRLARDLLRQAHAGDLRPPRLRRAHGREGRHAGTRARSSSATAPVYRFDLLPEPGHSARPSSTCSSTTSRNTSSSAAARAAASSCAGATRSSASRRRDDGVDADGRDARRPLRARRRLAGRLRRRAQSRCAHAAGAARSRAGVPRPLPDRRRPASTGDLPGGALVLVRPAVPSEPDRAAAPPGRRRLAHRLPARLGRRPGRGEEAGEHRPPRVRADARRRRRRFELEWASVYTFACRAWSASATAA